MHRIFHQQYSRLPAISLTRTLILLALVLSGFRSAGQYENVWAFGYGGGLDFTMTNPVSIQTNISGRGEACASVCNANGQLLFYTEGLHIWDKNNNVMPNGDDLTALGTFGFLETGSSAQGAIIIPQPKHPSRYFIFSITENEEGVNAGRLYYTIVDMDLNGGLGDVVQGSKGILLDSNLTEKMTAVLGDFCNVWLLVTSADLMAFKAYEITSSGLNVTPTLSFPGPGTSLQGMTGTISISPDRTRLVVTDMGNNVSIVSSVTLFDLDAGNGTISNPVNLTIGGKAYGSCFSPDNSKLYINNNSIYDYYTIEQFDLSVNMPGAIIASKVFIGQGNFSHIKAGPDGKLYMGSNTSRSFLNVIHFPNLAGIGCQYQPDAVSLLPGTYWGVGGLPNVIAHVPALQDTIITAQIIKAGCFANESPIVLQAQNDSTGWDYHWSDGSTNTTTSVISPGSYYVTYYIPPCILIIDTFTVSFPYGVLPTIYKKATCYHEANGQAWAYTYPGDTVTYNYIWRNAANDTLSLTDSLLFVGAGFYTLQIKTVHCDTTISVFIPEENYQVKFTADSIICDGSELFFDNQSDSHFTQYRWNFGDGESSTLPNPSHTYSAPNSYRVMLIGKGAICTDTAFREIVVDPLLSGSFQATPDSICTGAYTIFYLDTNSSAVSLNWFWGDGTAMVGYDERQVQHAYDQPGTMLVTLTTNYRACPETTYTDTVFVFPHPEVYLGPDSYLCLQGGPILLKNLRVAPVGKYHEVWSTGDTTALLKVVHPGEYSYTLSTAPLGCNTTEKVTINKSCYIDIPNAFSPNGDGANDYFFPKQLLSRGIMKFKMQVFDRWGQLVFETTHTGGRGWDGKFNGLDQPEGVYIYIIHADIDGRGSENYSGNVTLIR